MPYKNPEIVPGHKATFLTPFVRFLNKYRRSAKAFPELPTTTWKSLYFFCSAENPRKFGNPLEQAKTKEIQLWLYKNKHYENWFKKPEAMHAPREYLIPGLEKLLLTSPRRFGAHLFPMYNRELLLGIRGTRKLAKDKYKYVRYRYNHPGLQYLVAHCHGVPLTTILRWTGKTEKAVKLDVLEAVDTFVNTLPYWIWAYDVDMASIPFTQKKRSTMKFTNRLKMWNELNDFPQFACPLKTGRFIPNYLKNKNSLRLMGENRLHKKSYEIDKMFYTVPKDPSKLPRKYYRFRQPSKTP